ncbi:hypothetical protein JZ751_003020, partial [Albula glossodonta]
MIALPPPPYMHTPVDSHCFLAQMHKRGNHSPLCVAGMAPFTPSQWKKAEWETPLSPPHRCLSGLPPASCGTSNPGRGLPCIQEATALGPCCRAGDQTARFDTVRLMEFQMPLNHNVVRQHGQNEKIRGLGLTLGLICSGISRQLAPVLVQQCGLEPMQVIPSSRKALGRQHAVRTELCLQGQWPRLPGPGAKGLRGPSPPRQAPVNQHQPQREERLLEEKPTDPFPLLAALLSASQLFSPALNYCQGRSELWGIWSNTALCRFVVNEKAPSEVFKMEECMEKGGVQMKGLSLKENKKLEYKGSTRCNSPPILHTYRTSPSIQDDLQFLRTQLPCSLDYPAQSKIPALLAISNFDNFRHVHAEALAGKVQLLLKFQWLFHFHSPGLIIHGDQNGQGGCQSRESRDDVGGGREAPLRASAQGTLLSAQLAACRRPPASGGGGGGAGNTGALAATTWPGGRTEAHICHSINFLLSGTKDREHHRWALAIRQGGRGLYMRDPFAVGSQRESD